MASSPWPSCRSSRRARRGCSTPPIGDALARAMRIVAIIAAPAEWLLSASTDLVLRLLPIRTRSSTPVTEDEINLMLREGAAAGHFHRGETEIVQMALRLGDRRVGAVMT